LKELLSADLVTAERDGRQILYRANYAGIHGLVEFLLRDCCRPDKDMRSTDALRSSLRGELEPQ
ncbi:MAG: ArsR family transcriptional regulator, partial [Pseudomonadota bacterium]